MKQLKLDVDSLYYLLKWAWSVPSDRRSKPLKGDVVIEITRFVQDSTMIGIYEGIDEEGCPLVLGLEGDKQRWINAEAIVVKMCTDGPFVVQETIRGDGGAMNDFFAKLHAHTLREFLGKWSIASIVTPAHQPCSNFHEKQCWWLGSKGETHPDLGGFWQDGDCLGMPSNCWHYGGVADTLGNHYYHNSLNWRTTPAPASSEH